METLFLTDEEVARLTGSQQAATQERILVDEMGLRAFRNRAGRVMVTREALIRWQLGEKPATKEKREPTLRLRTN